MSRVAEALGPLYGVEGLQVVLGGLTLIVTTVGLAFVYLEVRAARQQSEVGALGQIVQLMTEINKIVMTRSEYAVQITTDLAHWGGSSGASLGEGVSWGKQQPAGWRVEWSCDATIALPLLAHGLADRLKRRDRRRLDGLVDGAR